MYIISSDYDGFRLSHSCIYSAVSEDVNCIYKYYDTSYSHSINCIALQLFWSIVSF